MRILPVSKGYNQISKTSIKNQTRFERNEVLIPKSNHQYTGIASIDLAYASMFDNAIANDLRLMELI